MGEIVTGKQNVWCNGAQISVVLDPANHRAYLQTANAYLREQTLSAGTKNLYGLSADATPDDAFALFGMHWWKRRTEETGYVEEIKYEDATLPNKATYVFYYGDSFTVEGVTYHLSNPTKLTLSYANAESQTSNVRGKYFMVDASSGKVLYYAGNHSGGAFSMSAYQPSSYVDPTIKIYRPTIVKYSKTYYENVGEYEYLSSPNRNAYPDSGIDGIFTYTYIGVPFENARDVEKIYTVAVGTSWTASGDYFYQDIAVNGITATDNPIVDIKCDSDNAANLVYAENMGKVFRITTSDGFITVWATEAIVSSFPIRIKVVG